MHVTQRIHIWASTVSNLIEFNDTKGFSDNQVKICGEKNVVEKTELYHLCMLTLIWFKTEAVVQNAKEHFKMKSMKTKI